jgi:hypothetical protein
MPFRSLKAKHTPHTPARKNRKIEHGIWGKTLPHNTFTKIRTKIRTKNTK